MSEEHHPPGEEHEEVPGPYTEPDEDEDDEDDEDEEDEEDEDDED